MLNKTKNDLIAENYQLKEEIKNLWELAPEFKEINISLYEAIKAKLVYLDRIEILEGYAKECSKNGLSYELFYTEHGKKVLSINGFSKSGSAQLTLEKGLVSAETRYNTITPIYSFDDIVALAFKWYNDYSSREPFAQPDSKWLPIFIKKGLIIEKVEKTYEKA